ncbi:flavin oxidoreductase [Vibrio sp. vnigr-6D03]|uniref:flavin reductase family protein n=1 Tax=Vibrio sp. vnigr-6D03 TaxID=2058088 RepID=UPI000C3401E6|nr:flavin reductase [Vibrio sp. vnigr-6D03]PKF79975.1 flavin oxidoreductase [Vibrio sp. vnigr-6D03]
MNKSCYTQKNIREMEDRYRARFVNSLSGYKSANLIGTTDDKGQHNLSIVSSVFHLGANPPLMGFIIRPHSVERHTLENILVSQQYTINSVCQSIFKPAHQTSARYKKEESEFEKVGLTPILGSEIRAPYVKESPIQIGLSLREHTTLSVNNTELIIGEIQEIRVQDDALNTDGSIDVDSLELVAVSGLDSYHIGTRLARLSYAKPDSDLMELE